jgi:amino acid adenylation domain-containing protein
VSIVDLLERLRRLDVRVWLDGDRLRVSAPPGVLTPELQADIAAEKPALIEVLTAKADPSETAGIPRLDSADPLPLSFTQERMWVLHELDPSSTAYHVIRTDRFRGELDVQALERAWHRLAARQDVLRTRILASDGVPSACVDEALAPDACRFEDLSGRDEAAIIGRLQAILGELMSPFDLAAGPLASMLVVRLGAADHVVVLRLHHIITDHWSQGIVWHELSALYRSELSGEPDGLPALPVRYADYAAWQRQRLQGPAWDSLIEYWRRQLAGLEPIDVSAGQVRGGEADGEGQVTVALPAALMERLGAVAASTSATLFMVMLAVYAVLLFRYTGRGDLPIGTPVAGRSRREAEPLVGAFINTLVLRLSVRAADRWRDVIERVRHVTLEAFAHQEAPFERLVAALVSARDAAASPLVQVMFNLLGAHGPSPGFPGVEIEPVGMNRHGATLDLSLIADASAGTVTAEYRRDPVLGVPPRALLAHYVRLLEAVAADPSQSIGARPVLDDDELHVVGRVNDTVVPFDPDLSIEEIVRRQAERTPEAVAIRSGPRTLTYAGLDRRARDLAGLLRGLGVGPDTLVGVCLQRTEMVPVAFLAILQAGGAYLPLDPDFPSARLSWTIENSAVRIVLTDADSAGSLPPVPGLHVIDVAHPDAVDAGVPIPAAGRSRGEHLAYVLYTSGSTGRPKGVQIPRRALANLVGAMQQRLRIGPGDVLVAVTTFSFDIAALELFLPLSVGAAVVLATRSDASDGHALQALLTAEGATVMQATPATWRLLLAAGWQGAPPIKVLCGGEPLPADLAAQLTARSTEVWNLYGPTETTIWSTAERIEPGAAIGIGRPLANTEVHVLDLARQQVPPGVAGELYIGGAGVARGYVGRPDLTARMFVPDGFSGRPGARLYRTGDLVRLNAEGRLEFLGRVDSQIKLRGFRIEPGEIETALADHPLVATAVVVLRERAGESILAAYFTSPEGDVPDGAALRAHLLTRLPPYMVPSVFVPLDDLPLTPNGKIDRRALPAIDDGHLALHSQSAEPRTDTEIALAAIWVSVMDVPRVGASDDFFALGGHSLLAMRLVAQLQRAFDVALPPGVLFEYPVLRDLARWIDAHRTVAPAPPTQSVLVQIAPGGNGVPFFWVHGVGGEVFSYMQLSRELGRTRPVFGFTADWTTLAGKEPVTLEMMAERYVREIRRAQPRGPYHLGGFCSAALLALEMARQLEDAGEQPGLVAVLDYQVSLDPAVSGGFRGLTAFLRNLPRWYREDAMLSGHKDMLGRVRSGLGRIYGRVRSQARVGAAPPRGPVDVRHELGMWRFPAYQIPMLETHHRALTGYRPRAFGGTIALFLPMAAPLFGPWLVRGAYGWDKLAVGGLRVHLVRGSHSTMLTDPFASELAVLLEHELRQTEDSLARPAAAKPA